MKIKLQFGAKLRSYALAFAVATLSLLAFSPASAGAFDGHIIQGPQLQMSAASGTSVTAEQFDGQKLYQAAFDAVLKYHKDLADTNARQNFIAEWQHKFDNSGELNTEDGTDKAILQMLQSRGQRFDYFMDRAATRAEKSEETSTLTGIGATLKLRGVKDILKTLPKEGVTREQFEKLLKISAGHELLVDTPTEGGPAAKVLLPEDRIVKVNGVDIDGLLMKDAIAKIKGDAGTAVDITVERTDAQGKTRLLTFKITRAVVKLKVVHTKDLGNGIAYIKLDNFMSQTATAEFGKALVDASSGKGVIIDLRGNPGGALNAVLTMAAFVLPEGTILVTEARDGDNLLQHEIIAGTHFITHIDPGTDPKKPDISVTGRPPLVLPADMPIVVLVDNGSASASEILSGVLQHHKRALIIGKPTHGKGVGQTVIDLPFERRLHVTNFEFLPGGDRMDWIGIIPNIDVDQSTTDDGSDNQLDAATKQIKLQIAEQEARTKQADTLKQQNHDAFQKTLDKRNNPTKP